VCFGWWLIVACLLGQPVMAEEHHPLPQRGEQPGGAIKLTRPDGTPIYVQPNSVAFIRGPLPGEGDGHTTIVFSSGAKQTVLETPEDIGKIMDVELKR
jgi:hypothetical protein